MGFYSSNFLHSIFNKARQSNVGHAPPPCSNRGIPEEWYIPKAIEIWVLIPEGSTPTFCKDVWQDTNSFTVFHSSPLCEKIRSFTVFVSLLTLRGSYQNWDHMGSYWRFEAGMYGRNAKYPGYLQCFKEEINITCKSILKKYRKNCPRNFPLLDIGRIPTLPPAPES